MYTRKSSEEGLDQEFNSLDAQRESAEAYVASQKAEGWVCLPDRYDDGGYTGGNVERPALRTLMKDIEAGRIDTVVVYKVDRLSRSLLDFSRLIEVFERHAVSFVSVTQHFNTTQSMGRLTLNILLSFAQFEREIISEGTRDKIAASRRKGMWMGGHPVLGYDLDFKAGRLTVNEEEAERVRAIFDLYLRNGGALLRTVQELDARGWTTKRWTTRAGVVRGGAVFDTTRLRLLLTNVLYVGNVRHRDQVYAGEHPPIVDREVWERVGRAGALFGSNRRACAEHRSRGALLGGLLFCGPCGCAMTPTYTVKGGVRAYRYYVCVAGQKHGRAGVGESGGRACPSRTLPAEQVERFVVERVRALGRLDSGWDALPPGERAGVLGRLVRRVEFDGVKGMLTVRFHADGTVSASAEREAVA
ncbi:MAG: recombinase family protein [Phycisphaerales bacterium]